MSNTFYIKQGDTSPAIEYVLSPDTVNLTAATVVFNMRAVNGTVKVNRQAATVTTATGTPTVQYDWQVANTDTAGVFQAEFEVTYSDLSVETFPNDGFIAVQIVGEIA